MKKPVRSGRKGKLNARTFAVRDNNGNIYVTVPVLLYKQGNPGYDEMAAYFTQMTTASAVALTSDWCEIQPLNSSTNSVEGDDDDK